MPIELTCLGWSVVLLFIHIFVQGQFLARDWGAAYNAGPRDQGDLPRTVHAGRSYRALRNYLQTYPAFIALACGLVLVNRTGGIAETGALIWLIARVVYLGLYLAGTTYVRTVAWIASIIGLVLMLVRFMGWV